MTRGNVICFRRLVLLCYRTRVVACEKLKDEMNNVDVDGLTCLSVVFIYSRSPYLEDTSLIYSSSKQPPRSIHYSPTNTQHHVHPTRPHSNLPPYPPFHPTTFHPSLPPSPPIKTLLLRLARTRVRPHSRLLYLRYQTYLPNTHGHPGSFEMEAF